MFAKDEDKAANIEKLMNQILPEAFLKLEQLLGDTKYICGDKLTVYDFQVAGAITVLVYYNTNDSLKGM